MATYYLSLTDHGAAAIAAAEAGTPFTFAQLVVGDASGQPYLPASATSRTQLVHQCAAVPVQSVTVVGAQVQVKATLPGSIGGFNLHEIGLTDTTGQLVYIGNWHGGYKPQLTEGAASDMELTFILDTSGLPEVIIELDPTSVLATRQWALDRFVLQTVHDEHVTQDELEHSNLLALIQTLNELIAAQAEELMSTQFSILQQAIADLTDRVAAIESLPAVQPIKIGGLLITTIAYADAAAVAAGEGYGTWVRHAEGLALVGLSDNAGDPAWTKTLGTSFGEYAHTMTSAELLPHDHEQTFGVTGLGVADSVDPNTAGSTDGYSTTVDYIGTQSAKAPLSTKLSGDGEPFNVVQPSIVIGVWRRTA